MKVFLEENFYISLSMNTLSLVKLWLNKIKYKSHRKIIFKKESKICVDIICLK